MQKVSVKDTLIRPHKISKAPFHANKSYSAPVILKKMRHTRYKKSKKIKKI